MTAIMCGGLGGVSKLIMDGLNTTTYFHRDKLLRALIDRPAGQVCWQCVSDWVHMRRRMAACNGCVTAQPDMCVALATCGRDRAW